MYIRTQKVKLGLEWASSRIRVDPALLHAACWHLWNSPKIAGNNKSRSKAVAPPSIRSGSDPAVPGHTRVFWTHCHGCSKEADKQENRTVKKQRQISHKENAKQTVYSDQFEGKKRCYCRTLDPWPNILDAKSCHRTRSQKSAAFGGFKLVPQISPDFRGHPTCSSGKLGFLWFLAIFPFAPSSCCCCCWLFHWKTLNPWLSAPGVPPFPTRWRFAPWCWELFGGPSPTFSNSYPKNRNPRIRGTIRVFILTAMRKQDQTSMVEHQAVQNASKQVPGRCSTVFGHMYIPCLEVGAAKCRWRNLSFLMPLFENDKQARMSEI